MGFARELPVDQRSFDTEFLCKCLLRKGAFALSLRALKSSLRTRPMKRPA